MNGHFAGGRHDHGGAPLASTATAADSSRPSRGLDGRGDHFGLEGLGHRIEDSFRARDDVLAMISHDLKNPLNAILLGVASLEGGHDDRALQIIKRAAWRMKCSDALKSIATEWRWRVPNSAPKNYPTGLKCTIGWAAQPVNALVARQQPSARVGPRARLPAKAQAVDQAFG